MVVILVFECCASMNAPWNAAPSAPFTVPVMVAALQVETRKTYNPSNPRPLFNNRIDLAPSYCSGCMLMFVHHDTKRRPERSSGAQPDPTLTRGTAGHMFLRESEITFASMGEF